MAGPKTYADAAAQSPTIRGLDDAEGSEATETTIILEDESRTAALYRKNRWDGLDDFKGSPWWRTPSVFWLLGPYALFTLAFGGVLVPKLNLILSLVCKKYYADRSLHGQPISAVFLGGDDPQCNIPEVQSATATFTLVMNFLTGLLSAFVAPKFGQWSDRYGRSRLMALASCGGLCAEIITIFAAKYPEVVDYRWLILGSVLDGATGSFTAGGILAQSYVSDCTPPSKRAVSIGYTHACLFTGLALGPLLAGYFVKWTGSLLILFYVVAGCHTFFIIFIGFVIPESMSKRRRLAAQEKWEKEKKGRAQNTSWQATIKNSNPFEALRILWPRGPGTSFRLRVNLLTLAVSDTIITGTSMSAGAVIILYSKFIFNWGTLEGSIFVSAVSLIRVVTLMGIFPVINYFGRVRPAQRRRALGLADKNIGADPLDVWVIRVALTSEIVGCIGYFLARDARVFFGSGMVTALGGLGSATIQAVVTKHIPADKIGQVLGAIGMLHALARVVGPIMFNGIYAVTVGTFPQAFFMVLAGLFGIAFTGSFLLKPHVHWDAEEESDEETEPLNRSFRARSDHTLPIDEDQVVIQ